MKYNGFTLIEVLVATGILTTVILLFTPMVSILLKEQTVLSDRRIILYSLHDELQPYLWEKTTVPDEFKVSKHGRYVTYQFKRNDIYIKGCAKWENVRKTNETICLYGIPQE